MTVDHLSRVRIPLGTPPDTGDSERNLSFCPIDNGKSTLKAGTFIKTSSFVLIRYCRMNIIELIFNSRLITFH